MGRPITLGDIAKILEHGEAICDALPNINEAQLVGYLEEITDDPAARAKFHRHVRGLADVLRVLSDAPLSSGKV